MAILIRNTRFSNPAERRRQRGSALLSVVLFSSVFLVVAVTTASFVLHQSRLASRSFAYQQALQVSEAGAEVALVELNKPSDRFTTGWTDASDAMGSYKYKTTQITDHSNATVGTAYIKVRSFDGAAPQIDSEGEVASRSEPKQVRAIRVCTKGTGSSGGSPGGSGGTDTGAAMFGPWALYVTNALTFNSNDVIDGYNSSLGAYGCLLTDGTYNKLKPTTVAVRGNTTFNSRVNIYGAFQCGGALTFNTNCNITGDVVACGNVSFNSNDYVGGSLTYPTTCTLTNGSRATIVGGVIRTSNSTRPTLPPAFPDSIMTAAQASNDNDSVRYISGGNTTYPFRNGVIDFTANSNGTIEFPGDTELGHNATYYIRSITLNSNVHLKCPSGRVKLFMPSGAGIIVNSNCSINDVAGARIPADFWCFTKGNITVNSNTNIYAAFYSSYANTFMTMNSNNQFYGVIVCNALTFNSNAQLHMDKAVLNYVPPIPGGGGGEGGGETSSGAIPVAWAEMKRTR